MAEINYRLCSERELFNLIQSCPLVIDARPSIDFENGYIDQAQSMPLGEEWKNTPVEDYSENRATLALYSDSENLSSLSPLVQHLAAEYSREVWVLKGGFASFQAAYPFMIVGGPGMEATAGIFPNHIVDGVFQGSVLCAHDLDVIHKLGITHILNATIECQNKFETEGITYLKIEVEDSWYEDLAKHFDDGNAFIKAAVDEGGKVLVHCQRGISRSSSFTLAYMMKSLKYSYDDAVVLLRSSRDVAKPNSGFVDQLRAYGGRVHSEQA